MQNTRFLVVHFGLAVLATCMLCASAVAVEAKAPQAFTPLFNGKDLSGWKGLVANPEQRAEMSAEQLAIEQITADERMNAHWKTVDGALEFDGQGDNLCTLKDYADFDLYVDWKIPVGSDSGIYLRGSPQVQIWDTEFEANRRHGADKGSGALWNNQHNQRFPLIKADKPIGEWNTFHIRMLGEHATVKLNGKLVVDDVVMENAWERSRPIYPSGSIELQNHGNTLWFRNVLVHEIPPAEANAILSARDADRFETIFNGKDFTGWAGDTDSFEVRNGTIRCKLVKSGTVFTKKEYADFVVRLEFKLPPGGNNGLAIRYPGTGGTHLAGMCELQVLDSEHPSNAKLDPRQYHGSAYGMASAHRGYLRPTGQWNFQQVTVKGSTIKVELNGYTILDTDLSQISEYMDDAPHPGKSLTSGHFGFAGHNDPVAFRNIAICELEPETESDKQAPITPTTEPIDLLADNLAQFYTWLRDTKYEDPREVFTIDDGVLRVSGDGWGGLTTKHDYTNYHMICEFKWGVKTWGNRKNAARDSGLLVHCIGPDGGFDGVWMAAIEAQIIEGGVGDFLAMTGRHPETEEAIPVTLTAEVTKDRDGETVWKKGAEKLTIGSGRVNWPGRDVDWEDKLGFRGRDDVESPAGEWTRYEVVCDGDKITNIVNGVVVNHCFDVKPSVGKILLQTEGAEIFVRRWELWPLGKTPSEKKLLNRNWNCLD